VQPPLDQAIAVDAGREGACAQLVAHRLHQRGAAPRRPLPHRDPEDVGAAGIEVEVQGALLQLPQQAVVDLAGHVPRDVAHHLAHDLVVDAAGDARDVGPERGLDVGGGQSAPGNRREVDQRARRRDRMEGPLASGQVVLEEPLAGELGRLLLGQLAPRVGAGVLQRSAVERVGRHLAEHVIVPEGDVRPARRPQLLRGDLDRGAIGTGRAGREDAGHLAVEDEHVAAGGRVRVERHPLRHARVGNRQDRQVTVGEGQALRRAVHDVDA